MITGIYIASVIVVFPFAKNTTVDESGRCKNNWQQEHKLIFLCAWSSIAIFVPLILITCTQISMYTTLKRKDVRHNAVAEQKRLKDLYKISKIFLLVVGGFFVCCIPYTIFAMFYTYSAAYNKEYIVAHKSSLLHLARGTFALMTANACINPVLYGQTKTLNIKLIMWKSVICGIHKRKTKPVELRSFSILRYQQK